MSGSVVDHLSRLGDQELAIRSTSLVKRFGGASALTGLDIRVPAGAVYVLLGPNGAGKTTTLRVFMDLLRADEGTASVLGLDPRTDGATVRAQIGYVPETHNHGYRWMRVARLLEHHAALYPSWDPEYAQRLVTALDLRLDAKLGTLSKGQARRVQILTALAHRPPVLLLDEPTDGLDPLVREETLGLLAAHIADAPTTVLISTHRVYEVEGLVDHVGVLRDGRLVAQTTCDRLRRELRTYRAEVPDDWTSPADLPDVLVRRNGTGREIAWTMWGEPDEVSTRLAVAGATVREAEPLSLDDAAIALLRSKENA